MNQENLDQIAKALGIQLPGEYCDAMLHYLDVLERKYDSHYLSNDPVWVIEQNQILRQNPHRLAGSRRWRKYNFVIGENGEGGRYYLDLQCNPAPVYLQKKVFSKATLKLVAKSMALWLPQIRGLRNRDFLNQRCPRCKLMGAKKNLVSKEHFYQEISETGYNSRYKTGTIWTYKCPFCDWQWKEDNIRVYVDVEYP